MTNIQYRGCSEKLSYGAYCPGTICNSRLETCGPIQRTSYKISDNHTIQEQTVSAVICFLTQAIDNDWHNMLQNLIYDLMPGGRQTDRNEWGWCKPDADKFWEELEELSFLWTHSSPHLRRLDLRHSAPTSFVAGPITLPLYRRSADRFI